MVGKKKASSRVNHVHVVLEVIDWRSGASLCSKRIQTDLIRSPYPTVGLQLNGNPFFCGFNTENDDCFTLTDDERLVHFATLAQKEQLMSSIQLRPGLVVVTGGLNASGHDRDTMQLMKVTRKATSRLES